MVQGNGGKLTGVRNVETVSFLATNLGNGIASVPVEFDILVLEVLGDARGSDGLGDDKVAVVLGPGEDNLGRGDGLAGRFGETLGGLLDDGVVDEKGLADAVVAKGTVGSNDNVLGLAELHEVRVGDAGVTLDLVDGGGDTSGVDDGVEVVNGEVGDTDGVNLVLGQLSHGLPGVGNRDRLVNVNEALLGGVLGEASVAGNESNGPVNEVELFLNE